MRGAVYAAALAGAVPLQVTVMQYLAIGEVRPDLCLALTCLVGFVVGERQGLLLGLGLGFLQDLVSASDLWLNGATKGVAGFVAGVVGRQLVQTTPLSFLVLVLSLSILSGVVFLFTGRTVRTMSEEILTLQAVLLPRAAYDAVLAVASYWLFARYLGRSAPEDPIAPRRVGPALAVKK
jgi:rod shape-determining protein MreD